MAHKPLLTKVTLELQAGDAAMVDLGKMLGPHGVPAMEVKRRYDAETSHPRGPVRDGARTCDRCPDIFRDGMVSAPRG